MCIIIIIIIIIIILLWLENKCAIKIMLLSILASGFTVLINALIL